MATATRVPHPTEVDRLVRVPLTYDDYLALPEDLRAEYVDGMVVVSPSAVAPHQRISRRLANIIEHGCADLFVVEAVSVWTGERRSRIPDVLATRAPFTGSWADEAPVLVAEILSPSTRREDTLRKSGEYLDAGIAHYWIVDPHHRTLTVLVADERGWRVALDLDDADPVGAVDVLDHGQVTIDIATLLAT